MPNLKRLSPVLVLLVLVLPIFVWAQLPTPTAPSHSSSFSNTSLGVYINFFSSITFVFLLLAISLGIILALRGRAKFYAGFICLLLITPYWVYFAGGSFSFTNNEGPNRVYYMAYQEAVKKCGDGVQFVEFRPNQLNKGVDTYDFTRGNCSTHPWEVLRFKFKTGTDSLIEEPAIFNLGGGHGAPIKIDDWNLSLEEAKSIALSSGGRLFLLVTDDNSYANVLGGPNLVSFNSGEILWVIEFRQSKGCNYRITINATTGRIKDRTCYRINH